MSRYKRAAIRFIVICLLAAIGLLYVRREEDRTRDRPRAQEIDCINNLKQIGLGFKVWAVDHNDRFPFNVSTNLGGTLELCGPGQDGFDTNYARHLMIMSNELTSPKVLVCPQDHKTKAAASFQSLDGSNITYRLRTDVGDTNPAAVLMVCPVDGNILTCDGVVKDRQNRQR